MQQIIRHFCKERIVNGGQSGIPFEDVLADCMKRMPQSVFRWLLETPLLIIAWDFYDGFAHKCLIPTYRQLPLCDSDVPLYVIGIPGEMLSDDWYESGALLGLLAHEVAHIYIWTHDLFQEKQAVNEYLHLIFGCNPKEEELADNLAGSWGFSSEIDAKHRKYHEMDEAKGGC